MPKVYGPYRNDDRWRVFIASGPGRDASRVAHAFATEAEAQRFADEARNTIAPQSIGKLLDEWFSYLAADGTRASTLTTYRFRLVGGAKTRNGLLGPVLSSQLAKVTAAKAAKLYEMYQTDRAPDTHQGALAEAKAFFEWLRKTKKLIQVNPWTDVDPRGSKRRRKSQHRIDDAVKLYQWLIERALTDDRACGVLVALLLGFRAHEVVGITQRDLDAGGTVLWAAASHEGKTEAAARPVVLPEVLRLPLAKRAELRSGRLLPYRPGWVRDSTKRACRAAGVPVVCAQALRGTNATLALEAGLAPELVARSLGHTSSKITRAAYALPGAGRSTEVGTVANRLANALQSGKKSASKAYQPGSEDENDPVVK